MADERLLEVDDRLVGLNLGHDDVGGDRQREERLADRVDVDDDGHLVHHHFVGDEFEEEADAAVGEDDALGGRELELLVRGVGGEVELEAHRYLSGYGECGGDLGT